MNARTLAALATLTLTLASAAAADDPGAARPGFYVSLDAGISHLSLSDRTTAALATAGVELSDDGPGAGFRVGYAVNHAFSVDVHFMSAASDLDLVDTEAHFGLAMLEMTSRFRPGTRVQPYLVGGLGGGGLVLEGPDDEQVVEAGAISVGGGVDVHVSRRWAVTFDYRYALLDFERTALDPVTADGEAAIVDGTGAAHRVGFGWSFSF